MNYHESWEELTQKGYFPTDGRPMIRPQYPELFRVIGYEYGGDSTVFLLPKVVDRLGRARYAIHSVTAEMVDVRLYDEQRKGREGRPGRPFTGPQQDDTVHLIDDLVASLQEARDSLQASHDKVGQALAMVKGLRRGD